jgi:hypothetical protein
MPTAADLAAEELLLLRGMPNAALDSFIHALMWIVVPVIVLCGVGALLLREALKWFERSVTRGLQSHRAGQKREWSQHMPSNDIDESEAPHCPSCNAPMVKRTAQRGTNAGSEFWGCSEYRRCHGNRAI